MIDYRKDRKLSVEDLENSIDIFGLKFDLEFSQDYIDRIKKIDVKEIEKDENVFNQLKEMLNIILDDKNAYNKISVEFEKQTNKKLGIQGFLKVFTFIFEEYAKEFGNIKNNKINTNYLEKKEYRKYNKYKRNYRR